MCYIRWIVKVEVTPYTEIFKTVQETYLKIAKSNFRAVEFKEFFNVAIRYIVDI